MCNKRKYGRSTKGNKSLKTLLVQCAKAAKNVKSTFFSGQYQRIAMRREKNRATLGVAHSILIAIYHVLRTGSLLGWEYYS